MYATYSTSFRHRQTNRNMLQAWKPRQLLDQGEANAEYWQIEFGEFTPELQAILLSRHDKYSINDPLLEIIDTDCQPLQEALAALNPARPNLNWCVRRFLMYHHGSFAEPDLVRGSCTKVSLEFQEFLLYKNAISQEQLDSGYARVVTAYTDPHDHGGSHRRCHSVVQVGRLVFDFTARQFDHAAPVPLIWVNRSGQDQVFPPRSQALPA